MERVASEEKSSSSMSPSPSPLSSDDDEDYVKMNEMSSERSSLDLKRNHSIESIQQLNINTSIKASELK